MQVDIGCMLVTTFNKPSDRPESEAEPQHNAQESRVMHRETHEPYDQQHYQLAWL